MKIVQSFNTFRGERMTGGFKTKQALLDYLEESYEVHKTYDYMMYTDAHGRDIVSGIIPAHHITVIVFDRYTRDRIPYTGKLDVFKLVDSDCIHVDLDATLLSLPTEPSDVYCEKLEGRSLGYEVADLKIDRTGLGLIPCSAVLGFTDASFKNLYISEVQKLIAEADKLQSLNYRHCWAIEEVKLAEMIYKSNKTVSAVNCVHLHDLK